MNIHFYLHSLNRDIGNLSILKYRDFDGYIVSGQHSGTQWFKYLLSCAIAHKFDLPIPEHTSNSHSNDFIGHPKHQRKYPQTPRIASTHQIPHSLYDSRILRKFLSFPNTVLLVRDIRACLVSNYEKWKVKYDVPFSTYLLGDISEKKYVADIWWFMHFFNRWGRVIKRFPEKNLVINYEKLQEDTLGEIKKVFNHFDLDVSDESILFAINEATRDKMSVKTGEDYKLGEGHFVRQDKRHFSEWYTESDKEMLKSILENNLIYDFGYDFDNFPN